MIFCDDSSTISRSGRYFQSSERRHRVSSSRRCCVEPTNVSNPQRLHSLSPYLRPPERRQGHAVCHEMSIERGVVIQSLPSSSSLHRRRVARQPIPPPCRLYLFDPVLIMPRRRTACSQAALSKSRDRRLGREGSQGQRTRSRFAR